jgi:parallel beta-helix repeat protein
MARRTASRVGRPIRPATILIGVVAFASLVAAVASGSGVTNRPDRTPSPASDPPGTGRETPTGPDLTRPPGAPAIAWVAADGDDAGAGTAVDPWRSPARAIESGARRIELLPGRHEGFVVTRPGLVIAGGGPDATTVVGQVLVVADDVEIRDLAVTGVDEPYEGGLLVDGAAGVRLSGLHVHDNSFGIHLRDAPRATIEGNEITGNGAGIEVHGLSADTEITGNRIHHNDRAVDASRGANGIVFFRSEGGAEVRDNDLYSNFNPSPAPGTDAGGGAFEIYGARDIVIVDNRIWDSSILETGTEDGASCAGLVFMRNVAWRGPTEAIQEGIVLRCAEDGLVAHNTVDGFDRFAVDVIHRAGPFAGSVEGLRVVNNIFVHGRAYSIDNEMPATVVIDYNLLWNPESDARHGEYLAYVAGHGNTRSPESLRQWGIDRHGMVADPAFVSRSEHDYRLRPGSPAIDAGVVLPGLGDEVADGLPDLGRWERQ